VPGSSIQYFDWAGDGYIAIDPNTGEGGYIISGGLAGGGTAILDDPVASSQANILDGLGYAADNFSALITLTKYQGILIPKGITTILGKFGDFLILVSAFSKAYSMYEKTQCTWKTGVAASTDFLINTLAASLVTYLCWLIIMTSFLVAVLGAFVAVFIGFLFGLLSDLVLKMIEDIPYCWNLFRSFIFADISPPSSHLLRSG